MAEVNSMAAAFGQAATQAPQPMHAAASNAGIRRFLWDQNRIGVGGASCRRADEAARLQDAVKG